MLEGVYLFRNLFVIPVILLLIGVALAPVATTDATKSSKSKRATVYYIDVSFYFREHGYRHMSLRGYAYPLYLDADLEDLVLDVVMNYTVETNYSYPWFSPLLAFGLMVQNYTGYEWETFKMKSYGHDRVEGNISIEVDIEMDDIESGDVLILKVYYFTIGVSTIRDSFLTGPGNCSLCWTLLLRILYNTPVFGEYLLHNWLLPTLAPYNCFPGQPQGGWLYIYLYFH